jgi:ribosomal protein L40E
MIREVKRLTKKVKLTIQGKDRELDDLKMLSEWDEKFQTAYAQYSTERSTYDDLENVYRGTKETLKNVNSRSNTAVKKTNNVPNIVYELIESEVNTTTPDCIVKSKKPGFEDHAKMIQEKIMSDFDSLEIETLADINERNTYMHGIAVALMNWNNNLGQHEFLGDKEVTNYHPKQVIPQPNIYDHKKMRYCFLICPTTKDEVKERTGIDVSAEAQQHPEANEIKGNSTNTTTMKSASVNTDIIEEIVCFYLDEDGDVCKLAWVGTTVTENKPKYYYPRVEECQECGTENAQGDKECSNCGSKKLKTKVIMEETIQEKMQLSPIVYPKKRKVLKTDFAGKNFVDESTSQEVIERIVPAGTKIPIPAPKRLPLLVRKNIPLNFSFRGRSDVETIRDQQESIKKVFSKAEEKTTQAGVIIGIPDKLSKQPSDDTYQMWKGKQQDLAGIVVKDLKADITQDLEFVRENKLYAKDTLGITDSYQGKYDPSANSGKAKQVQVEQAAGRLQSKTKNKFTFFADMFELMFFFDLCFTKEPRPYMRTNANGDEEYDEFNKYELLCQDASGEWYFNTDFSFKAEMGSNLPHDKQFLYDKTMEAFTTGMMDRRQAWEILGTLDFPIANRILSQIKETEEDQKEAQQILDVLKQMDPNQMMAFLQLPIEEQMQILEESKAQQEGQLQPMQGGTIY